MYFWDVKHLLTYLLFVRSSLENDLKNQSKKSFAARQGSGHVLAWEQASVVGTGQASGRVLREVKAGDFSQSYQRLLRKALILLLIIERRFSQNKQLASNGRIVMGLCPAPPWWSRMTRGRTPPFLAVAKSAVSFSCHHYHYIIMYVCLTFVGFCSTRTAVSIKPRCVHLQPVSMLTMSQWLSRSQGSCHWVTEQRLHWPSHRRLEGSHFLWTSLSNFLSFIN